MRILRHPRRMCGLPLANTRDGETQMPDDAIPRPHAPTALATARTSSCTPTSPTTATARAPSAAAARTPSRTSAGSSRRRATSTACRSATFSRCAAAGASARAAATTPPALTGSSCVFDPAVPDPVVVSQMQSHTGGDWAKTRHQNVDENGFEIKMEEDGLDIGHNQELYGFMAISQGVGTIGSLNYEAIVTPDAVTHNPYTVDFTNQFSDPPALFGSIHTFDGPDPSHLRQTSPVGTLPRSSSRRRLAPTPSSATPPRRCPSSPSTWASPASRTSAPTRCSRSAAPRPPALLCRSSSSTTTTSR